jgi:hypothetical protein
MTASLKIDWICILLYVLVSLPVARLLYRCTGKASAYFDSSFSGSVSAKDRTSEFSAKREDITTQIMSVLKMSRPRPSLRCIYVPDLMIRGSRLTHNSFMTVLRLRINLKVFSWLCSRSIKAFLPQLTMLQQDIDFALSPYFITQLTPNRLLTSHKFTSSSICPPS